LLVSDPSPSLHLAIALDGAGWHPAAWREPAARPGELLTAGYWAGLAQEAEHGLVDFVTIEDALNLQSDDLFAPDERTDRVRGRLDAVLIAARVAPTTRHVGFVPTAVVTHTEPFHLSKAIATLDYVSGGRAGVRVQLAGRPDAAAHFGRREQPRLSIDRLDDPEVQRWMVEHFDEAADYVEVLRRLWDSWEDDAEIRDVATGRFVDRDKLHYIDFAGRWFRVKGPSITPRPPQGQPLVVVLAHGEPGYRLAARGADLLLVTPRDADHARTIIGEVRGQPGGDRPQVLGDLLVFLDETAAAATDRKARLDDLAGAALRSDAAVFAGTPAELARLLLDWQAAGLAGVRLRPAALPHDLTAITRGLVPALQAEGAFRREYDRGTLRDRFGLARPANRYAHAGATR
jgi:alkanesulfonate monooxygenase SsuD/methylene tetrahydromethanopterin reductase-like flavin-dependent oxidoreductase (luciferase family)